MGLRRLPALLAAAVTAWCALSPGLGSGTRSTEGTAAPTSTAEPPGTERSDRTRLPGQEGASTERSWPLGPAGTVPSPVVTVGVTPAEGTPTTTRPPQGAAPTAAAPPGAGPPGNASAVGTVGPEGTPTRSPGPGGWEWASASALPVSLAPVDDTSPATGESGMGTPTPSPALATAALPAGGRLSPTGTPSPGGTDPAPGGAPAAVTQRDPGSAPGTGGRGGLTTAGTARPAVEMAPSALPATGAVLGLPVPTATASARGQTSPSPERGLTPASGVSGLAGTEGLPERGWAPPTSTGHPPALPGEPPAPHASPTALLGSPQPTPASSSAGPTSPAPGLSTPTATETLGMPVLERGDAGPWGATGRPPPSSGPPAHGAPLLDPGTGEPAAPQHPATSQPASGTPEPSAAVAPGAAGTPGGTGTPADAASPTSSGSPSPAPGALGRTSSGPGGRLAAGTPPAWGPAAPPRVFVVEDQPPLLRAALLRVPCELVLDMGFVPELGDPASRERRGLLQRFNETIAPLFMAVPGFLRLEVKSIRRGSVVLEYDALFAAARVPPRGPALGALLNATLAVGTAPVLRNVALERPLDPCAVLFSCRAGFDCVAGADGTARCTSVCHRDYCKNHGICTHPRDHEPVCQCPVGSDFWFMGLRCDYRVTQQSLLGMACGVLLSVALVGTVIAGLIIRRFRALLLEAKVDQTKSSYRRFCRLDDVSAQYWSQPWLASANSLDNPAFSNSEELLQLQILDNSCCSCREDSAVANSHKQHPTPPVRTVCRPSFHYDWDTSSSSMNDPMVDSGKASDISVSSWPMEPIQWTPFPILHQLSRQRPHKARRPHSYCEGMELANLERSWTA
ncbi:collagen alpha-1(I) chain-like [Apteryx mantelli]|uniref:Collagen alpha-1(I) chain-like n=1 Tax=Apteryx mantelli TaxID=2696672 RepID=A0ABM4FCK7_9AVES